MIDKENLKGKYITYRDKQGKTRTSKVTAIHGYTISVVRADKTRERVHKDKVLYRQFRKKGIEAIRWKK